MSNSFKNSGGNVLDSIFANIILIGIFMLLFYIIYHIVVWIIAGVVKLIQVIYNKLRAKAAA